ncbi:hypothetical protein VTK26DRAFT_9066 [Humicola hyalothermophila]
MRGPRLPPAAVTAVGRKNKKIASRGSWSLRNRAPTLPRVHHTIHGYPTPARWDEEALVGGVYTRSDYGKLRASARVMPEPPKPALIATKGGGVVRSSVSMGYIYPDEKNYQIPRPVSVEQIRPLPTTPSRARGRQRSTDSTLSEILKSTEKRLQPGSFSEATARDRLTASPTRIFGPREYGVPATRIRTPSPGKSGPGHRRWDSQQSVSSETYSLAGEEYPTSDLPTGLTSAS